MVKKKEVKKVPEKPVQVVEAPPKTGLTCVHEGCYQPKAPGQTHVCNTHVRTN